MAESIFTRVRKDLIHNLEGITKGEGYRNTVAEVYGIATSPENIEEFPAIQVEFTEYENQTINDYEMHWLARCLLTISLDTQDPEEDRESIVSDIKEKLNEGVKERIGFIPGETGESVCQSIEIKRIAYTGISETVPQMGILMELELKFRESYTDSTAQD